MLIIKALFCGMSTLLGRSSSRQKTQQKPVGHDLQERADTGLDPWPLQKQYVVHVLPAVGIVIWNICNEKSERVYASLT